MLVQPRKFGRYIVLAILVIFIFKNPSQAASLAGQAWHLLGQGASALSLFLSRL